MPTRETTTAAVTVLAHVLDALLEEFPELDVRAEIERRPRGGFDAWHFRAEVKRRDGWRATWRYVLPDRLLRVSVLGVSGVAVQMAEEARRGVRETVAGWPVRTP